MEKEELERRNLEYREEIERILEENNYLDNYLYAEYVITTFINDDRNYQRGRFFRVTNTNRKTFAYCEEVIRFLNPRLYKEYLEARKISEVKKKYNMKANINLIARGIETGHLADGSEFDILDFYRFIPFKESGLKFARDLKIFMSDSEGLIDGAFDTISNYMKENHITEIIYLTENNMLKNISTLGSDERITPEVIHNCFRYMFASGLPKVDAIFKIVLKRYLNGEIDFNDLERMEEKSRNSKSRKGYHNPHKLKISPNSYKEESKK